MPSSSLSRFRLIFLAVFLLVCLNLRMPISAADPLLKSLMDDLNISVMNASLFALMPVMVLGIASPLGSVLCNYISPRMLILYALCLCLAGAIIRAWGDMTALYAGNIILGLGLGVTGSIILGMVKRIYSDQIPSIMGLYTAVMNAGTALGSALAAPLMLLLGGWQAGLLIWAAPLALLLLVWLLICIKLPSGGGEGLSTSALNIRFRPLFTHRKAWYITLFYLLRVAASWMFIVWLPVLMQQRGLSLDEGGLVIAICTCGAIPGGLLMSRVSRWLGSARALILICMPCTALGAALILLGPLNLWPIWALIYGLSSGFMFALAATLIVSSCANEESTIALSGMSQGIGFLGGSCLAWMGTLVFKLPSPHLGMVFAYFIMMVLGLYFGYYCDTEEKIDTNLIDTAQS